MAKRKICVHIESKIWFDPDLWILMADQFKENLNFVTRYHWNKLWRRFDCSPVVTSWTDLVKITKSHYLWGTCQVLSVYGKMH